MKTWWNNTFEIILKFSGKKNSETDEDDDEFKDWDDEGDDEKYWFTKDKIDKINEVHNYLENNNTLEKCCLFIDYSGCYEVK